MEFPQFLSKVKVVYYHGPNCNDGYAAMIVVKNKMQELKLDINAVKWIPMQYGNDVEIENVPMLILDFSFKRAIMDTLTNCVIIDHHKTALDDLGTWGGTKVFDMNQSGAGLAWKMCYPDKPMPDFIKYIQDYDLYRHEFKETELLNLYISMKPKSDELFNDMFDEKKLQNAIAAGTMLKTLKDSQINIGASHVRIKRYNGVFYGIINTSVWPNEITRKAMDNYPELRFAVAVTMGDNKTIFSLRSAGYDVSAIAKKFGGGGHISAAAFSHEGLLDAIPDSKEGWKLIQLLRGGKRENDILTINHNPLWGPVPTEIGAAARSAYVGIAAVRLWYETTGDGGRKIIDC